MRAGKPGSCLIVHEKLNLKARLEAGRRDAAGERLEAGGERLEVRGKRL